MNTSQTCPEPSEEDLRSALRELKGYVDITEEDLKKIYEIALRHARERLAMAVPVREVMTAAVIAVKRDTGILEAARLLSEHRISGMPVVDDENRVTGVLSEADILSLTGMTRGHTFKDILRHILGEPVPSHKQGGRAGEVMSAPAITIGPDDDIREAAAILDEHRIKRLPVVGPEGKLVGIISRGDIVRAMSRKP